MTIDLPRLGLGTAPLAGLFREVDERTAIATVDAAWADGIRYFDTAPLYGSGLAEERLGAALASRPRADYVVSTKVGRSLRPGRANAKFVGAPALEPVFDWRPDAIRQSLAASASRLGLDRVDIALIHDPEENLDGARRALDVARESAAVVGVGTNFVETALTLVERAEVDVVLLAGRWTLLDRSAGPELLPLCLERGVPVVAAGVFNSGILAGGSTFDYAEASDRIVARRDELERACAGADVPLAAAAIQFPLRHPGVTTILVGARTPAEISEDARLLAVPIPDELWADLDPAP